MFIYYILSRLPILCPASSQSIRQFQRNSSLFQRSYTYLLHLRFILIIYYTHFIGTVLIMPMRISNFQFINVPAACIMSWLPAYYVPPPTQQAAISNVERPYPRRRRRRARERLQIWRPWRTWMPYKCRRCWVTVGRTWFSVVVWKYASHKKVNWGSFPRLRQFLVLQKIPASLFLVFPVFQSLPVMSFLGFV